MKIQISLSAPKFTKAQENILWALFNDKEHAISPGHKNVALDALIRRLRTEPTQPMYRGVSDKELSDLLKQSRASRVGRVTPARYMTFTPKFNNARQFAKQAGTDFVLEILPGPKNEALEYWKVARDLILSANLQKEFGGRMEERALYIDGLEHEREWIYKYDLKYRVGRSRTQDGVQILNIVPE